jgi:hypothetical protein
MFLLNYKGTIGWGKKCSLLNSLLKMTQTTSNSEVSQVKFTFPQGRDQNKRNFSVISGRHTRVHNQVMPDHYGSQQN